MPAKGEEGEILLHKQKSAHAVVDSAAYFTVNCEHFIFQVSPETLLEFQLSPGKELVKE